MKFAFAAALVSAFAAAKMEPLAGPTTREGHFAGAEVVVKTAAQVKDESITPFEKFQNWTAQFNKQYKSAEEFNMRFGNWSGLDKTIKAANAKADASKNPDAVRLAHNFLSDTTKAERAKIFTKNQMPPMVESTAQRPASKTGTLQTTTWVEDGKVSPTKDQGGCGSCYSFSATTALESYIAITEGTSPVHLSEQEIVDCSSDFGNAGCNGGHEFNVFNYISMYGVVKDSDYPYTSGSTGSPGSCNVSQDSKPAVAQVTDYGYLVGAKAQAEELQITPYSAGLQGENEYLYSYSSGILTSEECGYQYIDHGAPMVGYTTGDGSTTEVPIYETVGEWEQYCRYQTYEDELYEGGCMWTNEWEYYGYCCWWEWEETEQITGYDTQTGGSYFTLQNNWSAGWGEGGRVRMAYEEEGPGPCGINVENIWVRGHSL